MNTNPVAHTRLPPDVEQRLRRVLGSLPERLVYASIARQTVSLIDKAECARIWPMSSAARGPGNARDSLMTPRGIHRVANKIGDASPIGTIFRSRADTGAVWRGESRDDDLILTRILRLEGLEDGVNRGGDVDTFDRCIYIHGTNHERAIGQPLSHGCLRMTNNDVLELYDLVPEGTIVVID